MIEFRKNTRYQINTPDGFKPFSGVRKTTKSEVVTILLSNGKKIQSSLDHRFIVEGKEVFAKDLQKETTLTEGISVTDLVFETGNFILFDPVDVGLDHLFIADEIVSHNCDFLASGETVFEPQDLLFYEQTYQIDPVERRGVDNNLWIWESPDYQKSYMVVADVARGDSSDYSTFHIFDIEACSQVGEYKGKLSPKDFGNVLVGIASEYNDALLVIENANIGWATIEQVLEREYKNLYYSSGTTQDTVESYMSKYEKDRLVPGFTMSMKTRPLVLAKMSEYITEKSTIIRSKRLLQETRVFVWKNGKAQAQTGYNDDLVMAFATGLFVRDTALKLRQQGLDLSRAQLSSFSNLNARNSAVMTVGNMQNNPYLMNMGNNQEDITWLF
jgi:hypothetical protein